MAAVAPAAGTTGMMKSGKVGVPLSGRRATLGLWTLATEGTQEPSRRSRLKKENGEPSIRSAPFFVGDRCWFTVYGLQFYSLPSPPAEGYGGRVSLGMEGAGVRLPKSPISSRKVSLIVSVRLTFFLVLRLQNADFLEMRLFFPTVGLLFSEYSLNLQSKSKTTMFHKFKIDPKQ